ncbi:MAG: hypothetical protein U1F54_05395 [Burkholderiales bacterium]
MDGFELVLQFRGRRVETEDEVAEIEDALFELLEDGERWDGHEVLAAARNISLTTNDAHATFARLTPFLSQAGLLDHVIAAARPLAADAFTTLWPQAHGKDFSRR